MDDNENECLVKPITKKSFLQTCLSEKNVMKIIMICFVLVPILILGLVLNTSASPKQVDNNSIQQNLELKLNLSSTDYGCICANYTCGCCAHLDVPKIGLNDTACVNLSYLPNDYGISFVMTIDDLTIYNETISVRNPPPICFGAPILKEFADICIHFTDLNVTSTKLHGCVQLEARLHKVIVGHYKIGCFNIGNTKLNYFTMETSEVENVMKFIHSSWGNTKWTQKYRDFEKAEIEKLRKLLHLSKSNA